MPNKVIHQLEINPNGETTLDVIATSKILDIAFPPHYGIVLSVLTDYYEKREDYAKQPKVKRTFACFAPGEEIKCVDARGDLDEEHVWEYRGTVYDANRNRGYHVHEKIVVPEPLPHMEDDGDDKEPEAKGRTDNPKKK